MQHRDCGERKTPRPLHTQRTQIHVLSRFGSPIGVPAPCSVVADAPDSRAETRKVKRAITVQSWLNRFSQEKRARSIDRKGFHQLIGTNLLQTLLRGEGASMQSPSGIDHQTQGLWIL